MDNLSVEADAVIKAGGGPSKLGRLLGIHHTSVMEWRTTGRVPVGHVLKLEEITGIPRHLLRPDVYQPPPQTDIAREPASSPTEPPYGSTEWLTARRNERPAMTMTSVELLNALHDEE